ncbi:hypothetical protein MMC29_001018 [Sticta canariensis]|nr:hypothetical protein [Sticta canariensis]
MAYQMRGPAFAFCGPFSGQGNISASRWLLKYEHEMSGYRVADGIIPPEVYLGSLDMLLTDEAAEWSESHPDAVRLLADPTPTQQTVSSFKSLLCDRFPSRVVEVVPVPIDVELSELRQKSEESESLASYYKRVTSLMYRVGARGRQGSVGNTALSSLESAMLDTILRAFIRGLASSETRREATTGMTSTDRSLKGMYQLAKEARRTSIEIQKLHDEELRQDELAFYKDLAVTNMPKHKIEAMFTSFYANKTRNHRAVSPWAVHVDPPVLSHTPYQGPKYVPPPLRNQGSYQTLFQAHYPNQYPETDRVQNPSVPSVRPPETQVSDRPVLSNTTPRGNEVAPAPTSVPKQPILEKRC